MDTSKKRIKNKYCCNYCMYYKPIKDNGKKICHGRCTYSGSYKKRTDKCSRYFKKDNMNSFLEGDTYE